MKNRKFWILFIILAVAFTLRFWRLGSYPALNADEAAIGYNAYSLLLTGKDEHGNAWPVHFQSFNDYKPGGYFYAVLPFVKVLGLNVWTVRIPGAVAGVVGVLLIYFLVRELFEDELHAQLAALFLAVSPWHIHFSRGGWEVNFATTLILAGVLFLMKARKNAKLYLVTAVCWVAAMYTYHAARVLVPLLGFGYLLLWVGEIKKSLKYVFVSALVGFVVLLPLASDLMGPEVTSRAAGVGLFADSGPVSRVNEQRGEHGDFGSGAAVLMHNKATNYGLAFLENWAKHYDGLFLFISGDEIQRNRVPETGQMYMFDFVLLVIGFVALSRNYKREWSFVLWWLLVAPLAAALTFQSPHALRAHNMVIPLVVLSSYGAVRVIGWIGEIRKIWGRRFLYFALFVLFFWSILRYERMYWIHMAKQYPFSSQYGVAELVGYIQKDGSRYKRVMVTSRYDQPYILFLFYMQYPPEMFQGGHELTARDEFGFSTVDRFGRFNFGRIEYDRERPENPGSLMVGTDEEIPETANIVKEMYGSNGYKYFQVVAN